ncbi:MAG TPA: siderophore-interacting protein [Polyangiaceae bacterium]
MTTTGQVKPSGRIEGALTRFFMKSAIVRESRILDERFRLVTLTGESLRQVQWTPGQKVQVALGGWVYRTYTPLSWDAINGSTELLLFLHGEAPGSVWGRALKAGDSCTLFGPRDSLDLNTLDRPALLFGDETSFALAHAIRFTPRGAENVRLVFEVTSKDVAQRILEALGIANADLIERKPNDSHLGEVEMIALDLVKSHSVESWTLSGKASSIQQLNKRLRALGLTSREIQTRAYWAPGKVGLD